MQVSSQIRNESHIGKAWLGYQSASFGGNSTTTGKSISGTGHAVLSKQLPKVKILRSTYKSIKPSYHRFKGHLLSVTETHIFRRGIHVLPGNLERCPHLRQGTNVSPMSSAVAWTSCEQRKINLKSKSPDDCENGESSRPFLSRSGRDRKSISRSTASSPPAPVLYSLSQAQIKMWPLSALRAMRALKDNSPMRLCRSSA